MLSYTRKLVHTITFLRGISHFYRTNAEDSPTISTTSDSSVSTNQSTSQQGSNARKSALIGAAIGGSIGGVLVIASILGAIVFLRRRRRGKSELGTVIYPYITSEQQVATHIGAGNIGSTSVPKHPKAAPTESSCSSCRDCIYCQVPYTPPPSSDASSTLATVTNRVHTKRMHQAINQSHRESKQKKDQSLPRVDEATSRTQPRPLPIRPSQAGERWRIYTKWYHLYELCGFILGTRVFGFFFPFHTIIFFALWVLTIFCVDFMWIWY